MTPEERAVAVAKAWWESSEEIEALPARIAAAIRTAVAEERIEHQTEIERLRAHREAAVAEEREACARLVEGLTDSTGLALPNRPRFAAAIRARGKDA